MSQEFSRRSDQEMRIRALEEQLESVQKGVPGRKKKPILVSAEGMCGVDPDGDDEYCSHASVYRRQQGCLGASCKRASSQYYKEYRS